MRGISSFSIGLSLLVLILLVCSVVFITPDNARAQPALCVLVICKDAGPESEGVAFIFEESAGMSAIREFELLSGGECHETTFFDADNDLTVVENPTPGFVLDSVVCEGASGVQITNIPNGIVAECTTDEEGTCTFNNVPGVTGTIIPTLSEWGMMAAFVGLGLVGVLFALRRKWNQYVTK